MRASFVGHSRKLSTTAVPTPLPTTHPISRSHPPLTAALRKYKSALLAFALLCTCALLSYASFESIAASTSVWQDVRALREAQGRWPALADATIASPRVQMSITPQPPPKAQEEDTSEPPRLRLVSSLDGMDQDSVEDGADDGEDEIGWLVNLAEEIANEEDADAPSQPASERTTEQVQAPEEGEARSD